MTSTSSRLFFALLTLVLAGCQIPLGQVQSATRSYSLKLSLSSPSLKTGERALGERVLLPTAVRVDVGVKNDGTVVAQKTVAMTEGSTAVVLQLEVLKTYDFTAKAFDAADRLVFAGAMQVVLTGDVAGVLNLFPILTDAGGNEVPWPTVAPTVAQQPAGGSVTQAVSLKSGESTSFLLDFASQATEFTFTPPGSLEVYLQKVTGGGVLPLPGTLKLAKTDSPEGVWVTYFARGTPGSLASLGRFTIPAQSFSISGPTAVSTQSSTAFTVTGFIPANATNVANDDYDWSATGALSLVGADASGATFLAASTSGIGAMTVTPKLTPSLSQTLSVTVTDDPVALFDLPSLLSASSTVTLTGTADSSDLGSGIAEVWVIRDSVGATGHDAENPAVAGWTKATLGNPTATAADWSVMLSSVPDGAWQIWAKAVGKDGRISAVASKADVTVDTTAPTVTIGSPTNSAVIADTKVTLSGSVTDTLSAVASVEYRIDNGAWLPATGTTVWSADASGLTDGGHVLWVRATDILGNTSAGVSVNVTVNNSVGVTFGIAGYQHLAFSTPSLTVAVAQLSATTISTSDVTLLTNGTNWKWWIDGVLLGSSASFTLPSNTSVGFHTVSVFVTDTANGSSVDYSQSFDLVVTP